MRADRDPQTGQNRHPNLELVRITILRRVCTRAHMDVVAESVAEVWDHRDQVHGLQMVYEPSDLSFFQARFERYTDTRFCRPASEGDVDDQAVGIGPRDTERTRQGDS